MKYVVRAAGSSTAAMASPEEGAVVQVGSGQPLKAFPIALKSMKQGEKAFLKIKPECTPLSLPILSSLCPPTHSTVLSMPHLCPPHISVFTKSVRAVLPLLAMALVPFPHFSLLEAM